MELQGKEEEYFILEASLYQYKMTIAYPNLDKLL